MPLVDCFALVSLPLRPAKSGSEHGKNVYKCLLDACALNAPRDVWSRASSANPSPHTLAVAVALCVIKSDEKSLALRQLSIFLSPGSWCVGGRRGWRERRSCNFAFGVDCWYHRSRQIASASSHVIVFGSSNSARCEIRPWPLFWHKQVLHSTQQNIKLVKFHTPLPSWRFSNNFMSARGRFPGATQKPLRNVRTNEGKLFVKHNVRLVLMKIYERSPCFVINIAEARKKKWVEIYVLLSQGDMLC